METGKKISGGFLIAGCDASEVFDEVEESLDQVAFRVECEVAVALDLAIGFWWDDRSDGADLEALDQRIRVISLVGEQSSRRDFGDQRFGLRDVVDLATRYAESQRIAERVDDDVDLCCQAAARPPYGFIAPPFFSAPALC